MEDTNAMTYDISTLNQSPISDVHRDFTPISEIYDISFTPSISTCMENIESNTSLIDEDEPHTMTHIHSPSESRKNDSGRDFAKATFHEIILTPCLTIKTDNIESAKNIHTYHKFRLKQNIKARVANTGIDSQSNITHDAGAFCEQY